MEGMETPMGTMPAETVELTNEHFPHLSSHEWAALERMRAVIGEAAVISLLRSASPDEQRNAATSFMHHEIMNTHRQPATPVTTMRAAPLKLDVSPHRGGENEPLARWFVELDAATTARQLRDPMQQVLFAMSNLAGRAKSWAYGKRLAEPHCFYDLDDFKRELKKAFEPPQSEFWARAEFLKLRQGKYDLHSYAQRARYLVSSIVNEPIDASTQVVTFMAGLNDGPIRNQLFREYPKTLDEAIERAMQEEFSIKQAKFNGFGPRPVRQHAVTHDGPEPMDISCERVEQEPALIVHKVKVDGYSEPLRALVDTGASNNFVRTQVVRRQGLDLPISNKEMIVRLANGSKVTMPKRVLRMAIECDDFRGEDEFILLDLDDKFDLILGMPWLRRYQPSIDWKKKKISVDKQVDEDLGCLAAREVIWAYTSVEDVSNESQACDGPSHSNDKPVKTTGGGVVRRQKKTTPVAKSDEEFRSGRRKEDKKTDEEERRSASVPDQDTREAEDEVKRQEQATSSEYVNVAVYNEEGDSQIVRHVQVENPPSLAQELISLPLMSKKTLKRSLAKGEISQICAIVDEVADDVINTAEVLDEKTRKERFDEQSWDALKTNPVQWPLPKEQVDAIDEFFAQRQKAGHVRESKSPHCSPTFCVKKPQVVGTPVPRKDMILDGMVGSTVFSAIDLKDGFYQIRMRESDAPFTAVSTPSGMLWEWMVMPQGLKNAPATFNRIVTNVLRPLREFAPSYFDDIFVHSKALGKKKDVGVHLEHLRQVFQVMRENKLYANLKKCIFFAPEIPVLGCFVGKNGVRADAEKVKAIDDWPIPQNVKQLRQWLGLANYLHKYTRNYAALVQPLTSLLKKDNEWEWSEQHQAAFAEVKKNLREAPITEAPVLALADHEKPFHVVCDASDYAIGCALMQHDDEGKERVVSYQSRQLRSAERNYPVHGKELLAMKYALAKFRVYLLGEEQFAIYTDHASLRTAVKTPRLSQRMARRFSFFAEYKFVVHCKPGKSNILADALSRRPDYDPKNKSDDTNGACRLCEDVNAIAAGVTSTIQEEITEGYKQDEACQELIKYFKNPSDKALQNLPSRARSRVHRYSMHNELLYYAVDEGDPARIVVPNDEGLRHRLLYEYHDGPSSGHLGREKTFLNLSRDYYWPHMYKWVRKYVRTCEVCQRVKPSGSTQAPLRSLPVPQDSWKSVSMGFIFGLPRDRHGRNGILVFVDRFSKMVHLTPVSDKISAEMTAKVFVDVVFRLHGLPSEIVSDRDTRFTSRFWRTLLGILDTKLSMSTAAHPETDGQTERVNRVLEDVLRSYATSFGEWSEFLPLAEFALNNSTHVSTGHTPFYVNYGLHPRVPASLVGEVTTLSGGGTMAKEPQSDLNAVTELKANFDSMKPLDGMTSLLSDGSYLGNWTGDETDVSLPPGFKLLEDPVLVIKPLGALGVHFPQVFFLSPSREIASSGTSVCAVFEGLFGTAPSYTCTSIIPVQDPASILVWNMDATGTPLGPAVPETVELTIEGFHHLSSHEWMALERMRDVIGEAAVVSLLRSASPEDQKSAVVSFMHHEIMSSRKQVATPVSSIRTVPLKLDASPHRGGENEPLSRWFVELDAAITARQLRDPSQQVLFAMSNLAGRAKSWAYGKRLVDLNCFPSYDHFKTELKKAFESPQSEFRARAEFLKLRQGRFDLHSYAQRARYLVSSIVDEPIDVPTQVVTFMTGLNDGPIWN
ncbi:reverse transcriptase, partial [Globisporangium splendens]